MESIISEKNRKGVLGCIFELKTSELLIQSVFLSVPVCPVFDQVTKAFDKL